MAIRVGIYSHFWLLLHEYTLLYMYTYMYIDIQRIQYTDSMAPSFVKFCQVYHAFARAHTSVYFGPILLLHEYTLHSYTTKYTLHYVYSHPGCHCWLCRTCNNGAGKRHQMLWIEDKCREKEVDFTKDVIYMYYRDLVK